MCSRRNRLFILKILWVLNFSSGSLTGLVNHRDGIEIFLGQAKRF
jgi:hypothetical protein